MKFARSTKRPWFEFNIQTATDEKRRALCFSQDKHAVLNSFKTLGDGCVLTNVEKKGDDLFLSPFTSIKQKTISFDKSSHYQITSLQTIITEMVLYDRVNITAKVINIHKPTAGQLNLRKMTVVDADATPLELVIFGKLSNLDLKDKQTYLITNLSVANSINGKKHLKSTEMTDIIESEEEFEIPDNLIVSTSTLHENVSIEKIDSKSFDQTHTCSCGAPVTLEGPIVTCAVCSSKMLAKNCKEQTRIRFKITSKDSWFTIESDILKSILPKDISIGDNEDFLVFILSKCFEFSANQDEVLKIAFHKEKEKLC